MILSICLPKLYKRKKIKGEVMAEIIFIYGRIAGRLKRIKSGVYIEKNNNKMESVIAIYVQNGYLM